jgi:hypothetical protein
LRRYNEDLKALIATPLKSKKKKDKKMKEEAPTA